MKATWWKKNRRGDWVRYPTGGPRCQVTGPVRTSTVPVRTIWYWSVRRGESLSHGSASSEQAAKDAADKAAE